MNENVRDDVEMTEETINPTSFLLTGNMLPQRKYLSNRTGQLLTRKQKESSINRLKRRELDIEEEQLNCIKKLKVEQ